MLGIFKRINASSRLYNEQTFYRTFERDLASCNHEVIIESPFMTTRRLKTLLPLFQKLINRGVKVIVNTKPPYEHEDFLHFEAREGIAMLHDVGVEVLYTGGHHRKLAIFDRQILWEGSLNILSQNDSCEVMRRTTSADTAMQMFRFIGVDRFLD